jgi:type II secretory pathway pseudopilin PulG
MRRRGLRSPNYQITNHKSQIPQRGYMMITLILALALMLMALSAVLPAIKQQIVRDREIELRHRGNSYARAIQHFYKKFGRYPSRLEELENTNNMRFLRKRYTDPVNRDKKTGKELDFKLLHQQDITLNNGPVLGGQAPGQSAFGGQGGPQGQSPFGGAPGGFGGSQGGTGAFGAQSSGAQSSGAQSGGIQPTGGADAQNSASSDSSSSDSSNSSGAGDNSNSNGSASNSNSSSNSGSGFSGPTFGGGPILGVASLSKEKTIHVFYDKNHYNDWLFIYVPQADRGGLLTGPISTTALAGGLTGAIPGQAGGQPMGGAAGQGISTNGFQSQSPITSPQSPQSPVQTTPQN